MKNAIIRLENIKKRYGYGDTAVQALDGIHLCLEPESFTAVVGKSGSGKTTLLNITGGLEEPTEGTVVIKDQNLFRLSDKQRTIFRRRHIGYVFQFFNLIPEMTVYENICLPVYLDHNIPDSTFIGTILERLHLTSKKDRYAAELSGGEQQRTAVARALASKPFLLIADEPTGNLDRKSSEEFMDLLQFSHRYFNQTILMATHDLDLARMAERIITLEDGKILSDTDGKEMAPR